jgi:hypothetical protein
MTAAVHDPEEPEPEEPPRPPEPVRAAGTYEDRGPAEDAHSERGLRGLVGGGSSQVSVSAALRARDAARPTDDDVAAAESDLPIVRRGWVPREELPPRGPRR